MAVGQGAGPPSQAPRVGRASTRPPQTQNRNSQWAIGGAGAAGIWGLLWALSRPQPSVQGHGPLVEALLSSCTLSRVPVLLSPPAPLSYEDPAALDGGEKGMDVIAHLLALAPRLLKDSG